MRIVVESLPLASAKGRSGEFRDTLIAAAPLLIAASAIAGIFFAFGSRDTRDAYAPIVVAVVGAVLVGVAVTFWLL